MPAIIYVSLKFNCVMKIKTIISDISHDDLVNLFSTATYGSEYFSALYKKSDYYGTELESDDDCREDVWAKLLLAGKSIKWLDFFAEDENDFYGKLPHEWDERREAMKYTLTLNDLVKGLERAIRKENYLMSYLVNLMEDNGCFDIIEAEALMQCVIFGEEIYG